MWSRHAEVCSIHHNTKPAKTRRGGEELGTRSPQFLRFNSPFMRQAVDHLLNLTQAHSTHPIYRHCTDEDVSVS